MFISEGTCELGYPPMRSSRKRIPTVQMPSEESTKGKKKCWHPYSLQSLNSSQFLKIADLILNGQHKLLNI